MTKQLQSKRTVLRASGRWSLGLLLLALGCGAEEQELAGLESYDQALNACDEMVPANRQIDGIPAYAQCSMYQNGPIYSNNGVDTSATKVGADWVQTQPSGGYQCTELAHRYWLFRWQVRWLPRGNAGTWCDTQPPASSGVVQSTTPMHGDLMVLAPGSCGADATTGHVTVVDVVDSAKQSLTVVEQNRARRGTYQQSCARCFLHIVANQNGVVPDAGTPVDAGTDANNHPLDPALDASAKPGLPVDAGAPRAPDASSGPGTPPVVDASADAALPSSSDAAAPTPPPTAPTPTPTTADAGASAPDESDEDAGGCSVRDVPARGMSLAGWASFVLVAVCLVRRRRR